MIATARSVHPDADLRVGNVLELPDEVFGDVVSANGIFYLLGERAPELMEELIAKMFKLAERLVTFNSLSSWAPVKEPQEFYADPSLVVDFCSQLSRRVVMRHDYHPRDFTIYLYK